MFAIGDNLNISLTESENEPDLLVGSVTEIYGTQGETVTVRITKYDRIQRKIIGQIISIGRPKP